MLRPARSPSDRYRPSRGGRRVAVLGGIVLAVVAAPIAIALPIQGGQRNPGSNSNVAFSSPTEIIANSSNWGTRQSNKGTGGAAIYGCRTAVGGPACLEADDLTNGMAFDFISSGSVGGTIHLQNTNGSPLTTNATGVATGFNANYLQGRTASQFLGVSQQAADSAKLGGAAASSYVQTTQLSGYAQGQLMFADVTQGGSLGNNRGATTAAQTGTAAYTVTFSSNVSKCSYTASPVGPALSSGSIGLALDTSNPDIVNVNSPAALPQGFSLQVIC